MNEQEHIETLRLNAQIYLAEAERYHQLGEYENQLRACKIAEEYFDEIEKEKGI